MAGGDASTRAIASVRRRSQASSICARSSSGSCEPATPSEHRPVFVFGSPMAASGFSQLVSHLDDRTVITYDPRVSERSKLEEGAEVSYEVHGDDVHRVVEATGRSPRG